MTNPAGSGYRVPGEYDAAATDPGWAAGRGGQSVEDLRDPQDWGPLPQMYPDHPSAPVQRVLLPADHPSASMPAVRYPRQPGPGWQDAGGYRREAGPPGPRPEYATGWFQDHHADRLAHEAQAYAASIREAAERDAAALMRQANAEATSVREAAKRDVAEQKREAAEQRAALDSMTGELTRVAAYVTENLLAPPLQPLPAAPARPAPAARPAPPVPGPADPEAASAAPGVLPARPRTGPVRPATRPVSPAARPATPGLRPAGPGTKPTAPARPAVTPAGAPGKPPRQQKAMRVASYATATLMLFAAITGATEIGLHGFKFFVFRESGVGSTSGSSTDQGFLAQQAAAAHHAQASTGRHARG